MDKFLYYLNLKQFLATAATLALVVPAVKAESHWLILKIAARHVVVMEKIEMESLAQCESKGKWWRTQKPHSKESYDYHCINGK